MLRQLKKFEKQILSFKNVKLTMNLTRNYNKENKKENLETNFKEKEVKEVKIETDTQEEEKKNLQEKIEKLKGKIKKNKIDLGEDTDEDWYGQQDPGTKRKLIGLAYKAFLYATLINIAVAILFICWVRFYLGLKTIPEFKEEYLGPKVRRFKEKLGNYSFVSKPEDQEELSIEQKREKLEKFRKMLSTSDEKSLKEDEEEKK